MARKQRRDSVQEIAVTQEQDPNTTVVPKHHYIVDVPVPELKEGDLIVTVFKRQKNPAAPRQALKAKKIKEIVKYVRGCRHVHINNQECWDRCATAPVVYQLVSGADVAAAVVAAR